MRKSYIKWLSFLSVLALLAGLAGLLPAAAEEATPVTEEKTLYQQILERDGFIEGVWYPWFTHNYLGSGLTANEIAQTWIDNRWYGFDSVGIDAYGANKIYKEIYNLKAMGYNMLAYAGSAYAEGVIIDDNGDVVGIKEDYLVNIRRFLEMCRQIGMPVMWNILFHSSSAHDYYGFDAWTMMTQMYSNPTVTEHYVERFVRPLCKVLAEFPDVVALVALTDEIENEMNDTAIGNKTSGTSHGVAYGVTKEDMLRLVTAMNDVVKEELPGIARTVAANFDDLATYSELELDVMGRNRYDNKGGCAPMESFYTTAPMIMTEYNVGDGTNLTEQDYLNAHLNFRKNMREQGYQGGFLWCWQPNGKGATHDLLARDAVTTTDFREYAFRLREHILDARYTYWAVDAPLDAAEFFYVNGVDAVEWIPSRQAVSMDLMRSTDGGKNWKMVLENVDQNDYKKGNKCSYRDNGTIYNAIYKIVVRDAEGNTAESVSNNPMDAVAYVQDNVKINVKTVVRPTVPAAEKVVSGAPNISLLQFGEWNDRPMKDALNLIDNGSFEISDGGQWNTDAFLRDGVQVMKDATAPEGEYSLFFDSSDVDEYRWYTFAVDVQPNTEYVFSTWVKGPYISEDNRFAASIGVLNPRTQKFMVQPEIDGRASRDYQQIRPKAWDNRWALRSVKFNSGSQTSITIGLLGRSSQMWVDGLALYKTADGQHYLSENMASSVYYYIVEDDYCEDEYSVTDNIRMDDPDSNYWQSGGGWNQGFMSMEERPFEYGTSLKYTGGESSNGIHYIKWLDVKPNTRYIFSMDMKIVEDGLGKVKLLADKLGGPVSFFDMMFFDDYDGEWFSLFFGFNTRGMTRIGFAVLDKGGEALFDNIRLFEEENATEGDDEFVDRFRGWTLENGKWCFYSLGEKVTDAWRRDGAKWRYIGKDGYCVSDGWAYDGKGWIYQDKDAYVLEEQWLHDGGGWYYLAKGGYMQVSQWRKDSVGWVYLTSSGKMATNAWIKDSVGWCYMGSDGYCVTNTWKKDSVGWCYLDKDGRMATNKWVKDSVGWCYVGADGYAVTNTWKKDSVGWCYLNASGSMTKNAWVKDGGKWYFLDKNGYMVTNAWKKDSKGWVYLGSNGAMLTNAWCKDSKGWCYVGEDGYAVTNCWKKDSYGWIWLDENGSMTKSAWVQDGGKWYYLDANGYMVYSTTLTIGGEKYTFNASGVWVE